MTIRIKKIHEDDISKEICNSLRIESSIEQMIYNIIRRNISVYQPCTRTKLINSVRLNLKPLEDTVTKEQIDKSIDDLIEYGDLIYLHDAGNEDQLDYSTYRLIPCFPSFLILENMIMLFGLNKRDVLPINQNLKILVDYDGVKRFIRINENNKLQISQQLIEQRFVEIKENDWLKKPHAKLFNIIEWDKILDKSERTIEINEDELELYRVFKHGDSGEIFRDRMISPENLNGKYVLRYKERYSEVKYFYCDFTLNSKIKALDFSKFVTAKLTDRDFGWHIQILIDKHKDPQKFKIQDNRVLFFFPVPSWIKRNLMLYGKEIPKEENKGCLFSFILNEEHINIVKKILIDKYHLVEKQ